MGPGARGHGMRGCGVACCNSLLGSSVGLGRRAWAMGHGLSMGMDSWGVVWECGNLVVDGRKREREEGSGDHQLGGPPGGSVV